MKITAAALFFLAALIGIAIITGAITLDECHTDSCVGCTLDCLDATKE